MNSRALSVSLTVITAVCLIAAPQVHAQQAGTLDTNFVAITIIVPQSQDPIIQNTGGPSQFVIFTSPALGISQAIGCASDSQYYPVQSAVFVFSATPGFGLPTLPGLRASRIPNAITLSQTSPVPSGIRLVSYVRNPDCTANGITYDMWSGVGLPALP